MNLSNILAISELNGLFRMQANRNNGLIVEDLANGKTKFVSARKHQFSPLESISIYTIEDSVGLSVVFDSILDKASTLPIPEKAASDKELRTYFGEIVPNYDEYRVHIKDIKKLLKWYNFLNERNLLIPSEEEE